MSTIPQRLIHMATQAGERPCLRLLFPGQNDQKYSYADLMVRAQRWAAHYQEAGLSLGCTIVVVIPHSLDTYAAYLGALLAGYVPTMFAFPSPKLSEHEYFKSFTSLLNISEARLVVTYPELRQRMGEIAVTLPDTCMVWSTQRVEDACGAYHPPAAVDPQACAFLQFSSGTTGLKKGVAISHAALLWQIEHYACAIELNERDVIVSWLPLYHDMGLIACFFLPLLTGTPLVAMSPFDWVKQPHLLLDALQVYRGTLCWLPNFAYNLLTRTAQASRGASWDLSAVRGWVNCSEPVMVESHELFLQAFVEHGVRPDQLAASYAMAESTFALTSGGFSQPLGLLEVDAEALAMGKLAQPVTGRSSRKLASSGRVIPGITLRVLDSEGRDVAAGIVGEFWAAGPCLFSEYAHNPEANQAALRYGGYCTGDLGFVFQNEVFVVGRKKDVIIVGGKNIYPQDIEAIVNQVVGVIPGRCVALGVENARSGTEDLVVVAETLLQGDAAHQTLARTLFAAVAEATEVRPADVLVMPANWLHKSTSGKIARNENRVRYLAQRSVSMQEDRVDDERRGESTLDRVRRRVFEVVSTTSRMPPPQLRDQSALFSTGVIDSLSLAALLTALEDEFGLNLPDDFVRDITALDSIERLAQQLEPVLAQGSVGEAQTENRRERTLKWHQNLSKKILSFESRRRYELVPQLRDSDVVSNDPTAEFGLFTVPNFKSSTLNTDDAGFRVCHARGRALSRQEFYQLDGKKGLLLGNSTAFSVGAGNDHLAIHNRLNHADSYVVWYNLALRASGMDTEALAVERYGGEHADYVVWFSGYNTLKYWVKDMAGILRDYLVKHRQLGLIEREPFQGLLTLLQQRVHAEIDRGANAFQRIGAKTLFVLQPTPSWFAKPLTPEEQELILYYDYLFVRTEARVGYQIAGILYSLYREMVVQACARVGFDFVDANQLTPFRQPRWLFLDRIHLTDMGLAHVADVIQRWVTMRGARR
jgi:fatty-acyl-CoA synthase